MEQSTAQIIGQVNAFPPEQINQKPDEHSWSPGQILEHIVLIEMAINKIMVGKTDPAIQRDPAQNIHTIKDTFLDTEKKFTAFGLIIPSENNKEKIDLIQKFKSNRGKVLAFTKSLNLTEICQDFAHPLFGALSRGEWIYFILYHSERHSFQMGKIWSQIA